MDEPESLLTVRQVARACGRTEETVRRWIWSGRLPSRKIGNQHFIDPADVESLRKAPRAAEAAVAYATRPAKEESKMAYDRDEALKWLRETVTLGEKLSAKYGAVDVAELVRESREGLR